MEDTLTAPLGPAASPTLPSGPRSEQHPELALGTYCVQPDYALGGVRRGGRALLAGRGGVGLRLVRAPYPIADGKIHGSVTVRGSVTVCGPPEEHFPQPLLP